MAERRWFNFLAKGIRNPIFVDVWHSRAVIAKWNDKGKHAGSGMYIYKCQCVKLKMAFEV